MQLRFLVRWSWWVGVVLAALGLPGGMVAHAAPTADDELVLQAREAARLRDGAALERLRQRTVELGHPLAPWVDYWALFNRLDKAEQGELDAFYARWPGSYVEDRLRNDWLLELGKRRDWANLGREYPRFRMDDDREVRCYALLGRHVAGENVRQAAVDAWLAQRDKDDGCHLLATTLAGAGRLAEADIWLKVRLSVHAGRHRAARAAAELLGEREARQVADLIDSPTRYLVRQASPKPGAPAEKALLALLRIAASDPAVAATQLERWERKLPAELAAWAWAGTARRAAWDHLPQAAEYYERAWSRLPRGASALAWPEDTLAWAVRAGLRSPLAPQRRWALVVRAIDTMPAAMREESAWVYWRAIAVRELAAPAAEGEVPGTGGDAERAAAAGSLQGLARRLDFYALLAAETLGQTVAPPPAPAPLQAAELAAVRSRPGLQRSLHLFQLSLRSEGVREWNFTLRDLVGDRALLAAAALACEAQVWDRCINTSERTRAEVDLGQRYPTPLREQVLAKTGAVGLDPAYVYGLIRQESRFIMDARSQVGASGLMQLMPATARWTARKIGLPYSARMITDAEVNLRLGSAYLKLALDDFEGRQALAAAAYNAGPSRARRWRPDAPMDAAAWVETIPFNETRGYVQNVLANAYWYRHSLGLPAAPLRERLGATLGPKPADAPAVNRDLP